MTHPNIHVQPQAPARADEPTSVSDALAVRTGRCLCGAVQYQVRGAPLASRICWCRTCQKISAQGTVNAIFPVDQVACSGVLTSFSSRADSGNEVTRDFCPRCGCHLFARSSASPGWQVIRVGTLDDPSAWPPRLHMWASSAPGWACLDPALAAEPGQPGRVGA